MCWIRQAEIQSILTNATLSDKIFHSKEFQHALPLLCQSPALNQHPETTTDQIWFVSLR